MAIEEHSAVRDTVESWFKNFSSAFAANDFSTLKNLFCKDCYWRDLVCLTWNIRTFEGVESIQSMLEHVQATESTRTSQWQLLPDTIVTPADKDLGDVDAWMTFKTSTFECRAHFRLLNGKCRTVFTTADDFINFKQHIGRSRVLGAEHSAYQGKSSWSERRESQRQNEISNPFVVIIGGGQAGITLAARLSRFEVPYVVLEQNERPGDSWRNRYNTLCLHDPVWYDHLPYLPFPEQWPVYSPKDRLGDWLESYVRIMDLNYKTGCSVLSATRDEAKHRWEVIVQVNKKKQALDTQHMDGNGEQKEEENGEYEKETFVLKPEHLVFATGVSGYPNIPDVKGKETFQGDIWHSSEHSSDKEYSGKQCVVVGSNNSAHDIATELWEHDANVTMIQRSSTLVANVKSVTDLLIGGLYSENAVEQGITADKADLIFGSIPYALLANEQKKIFNKMRIQDAKFYEDLKSTGFKLDFGDDDTGLIMKYLRRGSGYYIDTGGSQLIIDGKVKLCLDELEEIRNDGVLLKSGTFLNADLIVFATGYGPMNQLATKIVGDKIAMKVGRVWGLGSNTKNDPGPWEGELRNMWKPTQQEGLWFHGGNLHQCRHYSHCVALQLKARHLGIPTPVYAMQEVHHKS